MRVVLDTNVLLAGFGTHGLCEALVASCLQAHEVVLSEHILGELRRNLVAMFKTPAKVADEIIAFLHEQAEIVKPAKVPADACRDASDLPVIGTAIAGGATAIVTGDQDLLVLKKTQGIIILTPRQCYERLR